MRCVRYRYQDAPTGSKLILAVQPRRSPKTGQSTDLRQPRLLNSACTSMLSINPHGPSYHHGHHRQNSSPAVIDPRKAFSPVTQQSPGSFHRRGSSFDSPKQHPGTPTFYPGTPTRLRPETYDNTNIQQPAVHQHLAHQSQQQPQLPQPGNDTDLFNDYFHNTANTDAGHQPDHGRLSPLHTLSNRNSNSSLEEDLKELLRKHNATDRDLASMLLDQGSADLQLEPGRAVAERPEAARKEILLQPAKPSGLAPQNQLPQLRPLLQRPSTPPNRMPNGTVCSGGSLESS